jgi:hypothetical protein
MFWPLYCLSIFDLQLLITCNIFKLFLVANTLKNGRVLYWLLRHAVHMFFFIQTIVLFKYLKYDNSLIYQQIKKCNYFIILYICQTSLTPPLFIEVPVPSLESERSCICVLPLRFSFWILEMFRLSSIFLAFHFIQILLVLFLLLNDLKL